MWRTESTAFVKFLMSFAKQTHSSTLTLSPAKFSIDCRIFYQNLNNNKNNKKIEYNEKIETIEKNEDT